MGFKIKMFPNNVDKVVAAAILAAEQTTYAIKQEIEEAAVVPFETGDLQNCDVDLAKRKAGKFKIVYSMPYARRLYWHPEYKFRKDKNANAQGEWLEPWLKGSRKDFAKRSFAIRFWRIMKQRGLDK